MAELDVDVSTHRIDPLTAILLPNGQRFYARPGSPISSLSYPMLSKRAKWSLWKFLTAAMIHRRKLDFHVPERAAPIDTESLRTWGDREIGADAVDYLLSVPISTLFFWLPEETPWWMPLAFAGMGADWRVQTPVGGMGAVPAALSRVLDIRLETTVHRVDVQPDETACLRTESRTGTADLAVDRVVIATPAPAALQLLADPCGVLGPVRAEFLATARYVRSTTVAAAYRRAPEGRAYGLGVPTTLGHDLAAIGWDHLMGPDRAPSGTGLGVLMPSDLFSRKMWSRPDEEIVRVLAEAVERIYPGSRGDLLFSHASLVACDADPIARADSPVGRGLGSRSCPGVPGLHLRRLLAGTVHGTGAERRFALRCRGVTQHGPTHSGSPGQGSDHYRELTHRIRRKGGECT